MHPIFQSPLHRGNHFNRGDIFTGMSKTLNFSPLFIGEITSTVCLKAFKTALSIISVPSSSGKSLQPHHHRSLRYGLLHFSPLFIGEITSTPVTPAPKALIPVYFSP